MSVLHAPPALLALAALALTLGCDGDEIAQPLCQPGGGTVVHVRDGDTIELDDGTAVRYLLVDTPETSSADCFADEALRLNELLTLGKEVTLEYDGAQCVDVHGRNLAYVFVDGHMINQVLIERGYARMLVLHPENHPEDYLHEEAFVALEARAQAENAGLWGVCL